MERGGDKLLRGNFRATLPISFKKKKKLLGTSKLLGDVLGAGDAAGSKLTRCLAC